MLSDKTYYHTSTNQGHSDHAISYLDYKRNSGYQYVSNKVQYILLKLKLQENHDYKISLPQLIQRVNIYYRLLFTRSRY